MFQGTIQRDQDLLAVRRKGVGVELHGHHASTAYTSTGALIPLRATAPTGRSTNPFGPPSAARVLSVTRMDAPRSRVFTWSRAAWFTASPTIVYVTRSPAPTFPAIMSPVQMP